MSDSPSLNEIRSDFIALHTRNFDAYMVGRSLTSEQEFYGAQFDRALAELRQERERADEAEAYASYALADRAEAVSSLSRAEETIEKVLELIAQVKAAGEIPVDVYAIERLLTEYDKQKSTPVDQESGPDTLYTF